MVPYTVVLNLCSLEAFELQLPETPVRTAGGEGSTTMEPITLTGDECSHIGGIQEKIGQLCVRYALIWITSLDPRALYTPSNSIIL